MEGLEKAGGAPVQPPSRSGAVSRRDNPAKVGDPGLQQKLVDRSLSCLDLAGGGNRRINPLFPSTPRLGLGEHMPRLHKHSRTHGSLLVSKQQVRGFPVRSRESDRQAGSQSEIRIRTHTHAQEEQSGYRPTDRRRGSGRKQDPRVPVGWVAAGKTSRGGPRIGFPAWRSPAGLFRLIRHTV